MKKFVSILLALCLCLSLFGAAAEQKAVTIEDLVNANSRESVFSRHENVAATAVYSRRETERQFNTKDLLYYPDYQYVVNPEGEWYLDSTDGGEDLYYIWFVMSDEEEEEKYGNVLQSSPIFIESLTLQETVIDIADHGDGTLEITTEVPEDIAEMVRTKVQEDLPEGMEGAATRYVYTVDAETLEIKCSKEYYALGDKTYENCVCTYEYDTEEPEELAALLERIAAASDPAQQMPLTVIYDAGTATEETFTLMRDADTSILFQFRDGYNDTFTDKFMDTPYDGTGDTVYAFSLEKTVDASVAAMQEGNYEEALACCLIAAKLGDATSYGNIGFLYENGLGTDQNLETAAAAYELGAEKGDGYSQYCLGVYYMNGVIYKQDYDKALAYLEMSAESGYGRTYGYLGYLYENGIGVEQDYKKAYDYYTVGAKKDDSYSVVSLGYLYDTGHGVEQDYIKAYAYYMRALEMNEWLCLLQLGNMYRDGLFVNQDYQRAAAYYLLAVQNGPEEHAKKAMAELQKLYDEGEITEDYLPEMVKSE